MTIYEILLTEVARDKLRLCWDYNDHMVVIARNRVAARMLAEKRAADEPGFWWREKEYSTLRALGWAPDKAVQRVVVAEGHSHG